jgi:hypothetical protein
MTPRTTQPQRRALDNLSRGFPIHTGFKSEAHINMRSIIQSLKDKRLMDEHGITELGLKVIKAR